MSRWYSIWEILVLVGPHVLDCLDKQPYPEQKAYDTLWPLQESQPSPWNWESYLHIYINITKIDFWIESRQARIWDKKKGRVCVLWCLTWGEIVIMVLCFKKKAPSPKTNASNAASYLFIYLYTKKRKKIYIPPFSLLGTFLCSTFTSVNPQPQSILAFNRNNWKHTQTLNKVKEFWRKWRQYTVGTHAKDEVGERIFKITEMNIINWSQQPSSFQDGQDKTRERAIGLNWSLTLKFSVGGPMKGGGSWSLKESILSIILLS